MKKLIQQTTSDRHEGKDEVILRRRKKVYEQARKNNPNRWSGGTRNWKKERSVYLNHLQKDKEVDTKIAS